MTVGEAKKEQRWSYLGDKNVFFGVILRVFRTVRFRRIKTVFRPELKISPIGFTAKDSSSVYTLGNVVLLTQNDVKSKLDS